jgi:tetratricopeptide (TPR) repeat protein
MYLQVIPTIEPSFLARPTSNFNREVGAASSEEKAGYYRKALPLYPAVADKIPDDPRPLLYQGLCYECLIGLSQSWEDKQKQFLTAESILRKALTLRFDSPDYNAAFPYQALASIYAHVGDYHSVLESLKGARQAEPAGAESVDLEREIQSVERYLVQQKLAK